MMLMMVRIRVPPPQLALLLMMRREILLVQISVVVSLAILAGNLRRCRLLCLLCLLRRHHPWRHHLLRVPLERQGKSGIMPFSEDMQEKIGCQKQASGELSMFALKGLFTSNKKVLRTCQTRIAYRRQVQAYRAVQSPYLCPSLRLHRRLQSCSGSFARHAQGRAFRDRSIRLANTQCLPT